MIVFGRVMGVRAFHGGDVYSSAARVGCRFCGPAPRVEGVAWGVGVRGSAACSGSRGGGRGAGAGAGGEGIDWVSFAIPHLPIAYSR